MLFRHFKKPFSLTAATVPTIHGLYGVTKKRDGELVAINGDGYAYDINEKRVCQVPTFPHMEFVAYGEYIKGDENKDDVIYLFETNSFRVDYTKRHDSLKKLVDNKILFLNNCVFTSYPFNYIRDHYDSVDEGFILTRVHGKSPVYKYKKSNDTVDFYIKDGKCWCLIARAQYDELNDTPPDTDANYFLVEFTPCSEYRGEETDCVVECHWKEDANRDALSTDKVGAWYGYRVRQDKTDQFKATGCGPNNWKTCMDHYENFLNPLTLEKIFSLL
jgi:hypothetical protein